jgi:hypothetical protein
MSFGIFLRPPVCHALVGLPMPHTSTRCVRIDPRIEHGQPGGMVNAETAQQTALGDLRVRSLFPTGSGMALLLVGQAAKISSAAT